VGKGPSRSEAGRTITQERTVDEFTSVETSGSLDVKITQGAVRSVRVHALEGDLENIETVVDNGTLIVRWRQRDGIRFAIGETHVEVTTPPFTSAGCHGSGDISVGGLDVERFELTTTGSCDGRISGRTDRVELKANGSGGIDATHLQTRHAQISATGSGDVRVQASERVEGALTGSGDIIVTGEAVCEVSRTGSGEVRCAQR
jgi:hypothetical protein